MATKTMPKSSRRPPSGRSQAARRDGASAPRRSGGPRVHADLTLRSCSGASIHDRSTRINAASTPRHLPPPGAADDAAARLKAMGLSVTARGRVAICVSAPREAFEEVFGVRLTMKRYSPDRSFAEGAPKADEVAATCFLLDEGLEVPVPESLASLVEKVHLAAPVRLCLSADPPTPGYFHLKPDGVARQVDAVPCHRLGITGAGTRLAMPDFGTFSHPYYDTRGYQIEVDDSLLDGGSGGSSSHGTAIAANALAVAPGTQFVGIRMGGVTSALVAVLKALEHDPDVLSISWGIQEPFASLVGPLFEFELAMAIDVAGVTVCCAAGNGGWIPTLATHRKVVAVGGVHCGPDDALQAASYASSGNVSGRQVPDLCGLVGHAPHGIYITLPCSPGSSEDHAFAAGGAFPGGDETGPADGWVVASGTSSAAPQVAAVACLLVQADPALRRRPAEIKARMIETAVDVTSTATASANGDMPSAGPDGATGAGLVDAFIVVNRVDVWLRDHAQDRGLVPSRGPFWESPDIKVLAAPLADPQAGFEAASSVSRLGSGPYYVYATVRQRGVDAAADVDVRFAYAAPCTLPMAEAFGGGSSGQPGITVNGVPGNRWHVPELPAGASVVVGPWVWNPPPATTMTAVEGGGGSAGGGQHLALFMRADCARDLSPFPRHGGGVLAIPGSNNFALRQAWTVKPRVTLPLAAGFGNTAQEMRFVVDASALPENVTLSCQVARADLDARMLQALGRWADASDARSLALKFAPGRRHEIVLTASGLLPMRWSFATRGRSAPRTLPVRILQLARGGDTIGGATLWLQLGA